MPVQSEIFLNNRMINNYKQLSGPITLFMTNDHGQAAITDNFLQ